MTPLFNLPTFSFSFVSLVPAFFVSGNQAVFALDRNTGKNLVPRVSHLTAPWSERGGSVYQGLCSLAPRGDKMRDPGTRKSCWWYGAFPIYKKFRKISIGNSGNFRLERERSICHKYHSFTSPSPSLHQKTRCLGKLFCYFLERVFVRRFPVEQMLIIGMCGYEKSDICMFPSF